MIVCIICLTNAASFGMEGGRGFVPYVDRHGAYEALRDAAKRGSVGDIQEAIKYTHGDQPDALGQLPLHFAAQSGNLDAVQCLAKWGADVTVKDTNGNQAIHFAAKIGCIKIIEWLLVMDADINALNNEGESPLSLATSNGHSALRDWLLERGALEQGGETLSSLNDAALDAPNSTLQTVRSPEYTLGLPEMYSDQQL